MPRDQGRPKDDHSHRITLGFGQFKQKMCGTCRSVIEEDGEDQRIRASGGCYQGAWSVSVLPIIEGLLLIFSLFTGYD
jgi:hypothetical protein